MSLMFQSNYARDSPACVCACGAEAQDEMYSTLLCLCSSPPEAAGVAGRQPQTATANHDASQTQREREAAAMMSLACKADELGR